MQDEQAIKRSSLSFAVVRLGLAVALLGLASWPLPIHATPATTITVTTVADELNSDGDCSLREAIQAATTDAAVDACAAGGGADTITFDAATDGTPIVLTGAANEDANATGDLDILDGGDLTIQGNGAGSTIVDGGGIDRVFHVCPGGGCDNAVTLNDVTVRNGNPGGFAVGGGIYNEGATLNVHSSAIGEAGAGNEAWGGGGIYNEAGTTLVDNAIIIANGAVAGGGILNDGGTLIVQNDSRVGELDAGNLAVGGGGIHNWNGGVATVDGSTITANSASEGGGGIYNGLDATTTVDGSTVSANACTAVDCDGGGICNEGTLTIINGSAIGRTAAGNQATDQGGGIYNDEGTVAVDGSSVTDNTSGWGGGGIYSVGGTLTVGASTVISNAAQYGGGIYNAVGTATLDSGTVISNTAAKDGGGIYNWGTLDVRNGSTVTSNKAAAKGGGIYNREGAVTLEASTVSANTATDGAGIANAVQGTLTVRNGSIIGGAGAANHAAHMGGGIANGGTATVDVSIISANTAMYGAGILNADTLTVTNTTIGKAGAGNVAERGGGLYNAEGDATVDASIVSANTAEIGAGICNEVDGVTRVTGSTVSGNTAKDIGAGIYNWEGTVTVADSRILNNTATANGGGVYNDADVVGATRVTRSCIVGNSDVSFFNEQPAQQIATFNWWGAATGPYTPGADTVGGNVDTGGYLTTPPAHCLYYHIHLPLVLTSARP